MLKRSSVLMYPAIFALMFSFSTGAFADPSGPVSSATAPSLDAKATETSLRDLAETLKKLYRATIELQHECNMTYNADALDNVIMDPWMEGNSGLMGVIPPPFPGALKPIPPRKKWVDYDMNQITELLKMLTTEVTQITGASPLSPQVKASIDVMQDTLHQEYAQYEKLLALSNPTTVGTKGEPVYDTMSITKAAQALKDEASGLNEIRKRLLRLVKADTKK